MDFQTPIEVAKYMVGLVKMTHWKAKILEPTPGNGNIVKAIEYYEFVPIIPENDFWLMEHKIKYDAIVMNPPFSPMKEGYKFLYKCMELSDEIVALMPWLTIINGEKRTRDILEFGLKSITHLPRTTFKGSRVQCCVLHLVKNWNEETIFYNY
jgi:hypothetical protein